ncbi:MAG TPA: hypothetical protein DCS91_21570 [Microcoleaceae bacterium UBA11344]|jgi:hypothetical protein|nr:hypothetical protein [Microcoleaceae cyanobacterium UBA11344]
MTDVRENLIMELRYEDNESASISTGILAEKRSSYQTDDLSDVQEPITSAPPEVRQIIERVLEIEKDKLYMKSPRYISDDILKIIKEAIL